MAVVTKSIGTTARDYSTVTAWHAASYGATGSDDAIGQCYPDSKFTSDEGLEFTDDTPLTITLEAAPGYAHNGTQGTGVEIEADGNGSGHFWRLNTSHADVFALRGIEIDGAGYTDYDSCVEIVRTGSIHRMLCHDTTDNTTIVGIRAGSANDINNCIIYDITGTTSSTARGIYDSISSVSSITNCTVYNIQNTNTAANANGIAVATPAGTEIVINNIACTTSTGGSCYAVGASAISYCLSSDATASGTGSLTNKTAANQFISTTGGSENLLLKAGADAINAGTDLGTTYTGCNIDIVGRDRDALGDVWDMGANELVAVAAGGVSYVVGGGILVA